VSRRATFLAPHDNGETGSPVFRSTERQQIIDYVVRSKIKDGGAELDEDTALGKHIVSRFPLHMQVTPGIAPVATVHGCVLVCPLVLFSSALPRRHLHSSTQSKPLISWRRRVWRTYGTRG